MRIGQHNPVRPGSRGASEPVGQRFAHAVDIGRNGVGEAAISFDGIEEPPQENFRLGAVAAQAGMMKKYPGILIALRIQQASGLATVAGTEQQGQTVSQGWPGRLATYVAGKGPHQTIFGQGIGRKKSHIDGARTDTLSKPVTIMHRKYSQPQRRPNATGPALATTTFYGRSMPAGPGMLHCPHERLSEPKLSTQTLQDRPFQAK
ncbi:MAG: hypothetical protein RQ741_02610 [Wenzhouxiangellaceae bacterium]|nr:hypothetical protein [Wenzhouxiangellaceae bacterium]